MTRAAIHALAKHMHKARRSRAWWIREIKSFFWCFGLMAMSILAWFGVGWFMFFWSVAFERGIR